MPALTDAERRGVRVLALLLALGTLADLVRARFPEWTSEPEPAVQRATPVADPTRVVPPETLSRKVNLDTATAAELDALPGIGPVLAARIVAHRTRHGPFRSADELLAVPGIGPRLLERLRPLLTTREH